MTSTRTPGVTVLMPAFNAGRYLAQAVESILRQSYRDFELLVIDDGSTDDTREVMAGYRDRRLRVELHDDNVGLVARLNEGLAIAKGTFIARLDADDVAHPDRLALQMAAFAKDPTLALVGGQAVNITSDGIYTSLSHYPQSRIEVVWASCFDSPFNHSAVTFRREAVLAQGGYDEAFRYAEDYELWSRLIRAGLLSRNLPIALAAYRHHNHQMTSAASGVKVAANVEIIRRNLDCFFPSASETERSAMATAIAETHFGVRPVSVEYLLQYRGLLHDFCRHFHTSIWSLRRSIGVHVMGLASLAKQHAPMTAAAALAVAAISVSPEVLSGLVLPTVFRSWLADRAGRFWEPARLNGPSQASLDE